MKSSLAAGLRLLATAAVLATAGNAFADTFSFAVDAHANSLAWSSQDAAPLDTGLVFTAGQALDITASGTWNGGGGCPSVGPEGAACYGTDPVTGINYFSLIGRVGSGAWFKVGTGFSGAAASSGDLFLAFDDSDSFNNSGKVTALVTTASAVPEPASIALLVGGLGLVGGAARRRQARG